MVSLPMKHPEHNHALTLNPIENLAGKPPQEHPPKAVIVNQGTFRIGHEQFHGVRHFGEEISAKSVNLLLIPIVSRFQIPLGTRPDQKQTAHERPRRRACTSAHELPAFGLVS